MPAFNLAVALRVVGRGADMRHAVEADKLLEGSGDELRSVVGDDPRPLAGKTLFGTEQDHFHVRLGHLFLHLPMDDVAAVSIQHGAEVVKSPGEIDVGDVNVPMGMGFGAV